MVQPLNLESTPSISARFERVTLCFTAVTLVALTVSDMVAVVFSAANGIVGACDVFGSAREQLKRT